MELAYRAGELQHGVIPDLEMKLARKRAVVEESEPPMLSEEVSEENIAQVNRPG